MKITGRSLGRKKKLRSDCHRVLWALVKRILALCCLAGAYAPCVVYGCTVGFTRNRDIVALVQKNVFRMYRVRTSAHSHHGLLPPTTNHKQENHGRIKRILILRYQIHFLAKSLICHCEHLLQSPIEFVLHRRPVVAVFCEGCLWLTQS